MKSKGFAPIIILVLVVLGIAGHFGYKNFLIKPRPSPSPVPTSSTGPTAEECIRKTTCEGPTLCMANPASVFCTCMGGELEIRENDQGQYGVCKIEGKEYDEWEYFQKMAPLKD